MSNCKYFQVSPSACFESRNNGWNFSTSIVNVRKGQEDHKDASPDIAEPLKHQQPVLEDLLLHEN